MADEFKGINQQTLKNVEAVKSSMAEIATASAKANKQLTDQQRLLADYKKNYSDIASSAGKFAKLQDEASRSASATGKALKEQQIQLSNIRSLNAQIENLMDQMVKATEEENRALQRQVNNLSAARDNARELANAFGELVEDSSKLDKSTMWFSALSQVVRDVPGLRKLSEPFDAAAKAARETVLSNAKNKSFLEEALKTGKGLTAEKIKALGLEKQAAGLTGTAAASRLKAAGATTKMQSAGIAGMQAGFKALGPIIKSALGPLALIQVAVDVVKFFVGAMFDANKQSVDLARNIQVTAEGGAKYRQYIIDGKNATQTQYKLTKDLIQSEGELATLSEASLAFSLEQLDVQTQLTKEVKLQAGEAAQLSKLFSINGESSQEQLDTVYDSVAEFANQNKILFNSKKVMEAMSKVSGQLLVSFKGNTKELANAVQQAMKLGINLQTAQGISKSMLNFEESISAELEAELLTGRDINLDRARALSMQGKYAEAAEEALNAVGSLERFQEMNVFQQEALAKAAGLTVDQLSDALILQKYQGTQTGKQIERFKAMGMETEALALANGELVGEQLKQATQQLNAQEKFNIAVERAKEIFTDLVDGGAIQTLADAIQGLADSSLLQGYAEEGKAKRLTKQLEEDKKGTEEEKAIVKLAENQVGIGDMLSKAAKGALVGAGTGATVGAFAGGIGAIPGAVGGAMYGAAAALAMGLYEKAQAKGAAKESDKIREKYYPDENQQIKANDFTIRTNPADTLVMAGGTKFGDETNALLKELISSMKSGGDIYIDSTKVGTALGLATFNSNVNFNS